MRILLHEHYSSRPPGAAPPPLRSAGRAIRDALGRALRDLPGVAVEILSPQAGAGPALRSALRRADAALVIAPEAGGRLARLAGMVERSGVLPLGSGPMASRIAGDKLRTARLLSRAGIPTPETRLVTPGRTRMMARPFVLKPRDGCGAEGVEIVRHPGEMAAALRRARRAATGEVIAQTFVPGEAVSVTMLVRASGTKVAGRAGCEAAILGVARQRIEGRRSLRYAGGVVPLGGRGARAAARLALRAVAALGAAAPDLRGPVGVDLVLGAKGPVVIEINPRPTTSWVGIRRVARRSLADLLIGAARGRPLPRRVTHAGACRFSPGGRCVQGRGGSR